MFRLLPFLMAASLFAWGVPAAPAGGNLTVTILDLRYHGLSVVVETPAGRTWLLDAGERERSGYWDARDTIAPFLAAKGITSLAGLLVTHSHGDHFGGVPYLIDKLAIKQLVDTACDSLGGAELDEYRAIRQVYIDRHGKYVAVKAGDRLPWDKALEVEVLSPPAGFLQTRARPGRPDYNNSSLVLRVRHGRDVFLFPADLGGLGQDYLLRTYGADHLRANVLVAPHHGFDSYPGFASAVKPEVVVVSCLNDYPTSKPRSPGQRATEVFGAAGAKVYVTAWHGTVQLTSDGESVTVKTTRSRNQAARTDFLRAPCPVLAPGISCFR